MDVSPARAFAASLLLSAAFASPVISPALAAGPAAVIGKGRKVDIEYTLTLDDGSTVQSNVGEKPLSFVAGEGQIIPGLETALDGKAARERVKVRIPPEEAYGPTDPQRMQEVPLDKIPEDARKVGTLLSAQGFDGPVRVAEVRPDVVVLDFNHPLAGKALTFDVLVLSIN
ncbi:MAG: peptidylprolyl isomerase [Chromatiales bacterium]|nr:peptidylprolyl isomerase [Chromatiales bacterium]